MPLIPQQEPPYYETNTSPLQGTIKYYTAIINQTGTAAPTATVLQNTLGGTVTWTRNSIGDYTATSPYLTENLTIAPPFGDGNAALLLPMMYDTVGYYQVSPRPAGTTRLFTFADTAFTPAELDTIGGSVLIQIIVYPS